MGYVRMGGKGLGKWVCRMVVKAQSDQAEVLGQLGNRGCERRRLATQAGVAGYRVDEAGSCIALRFPNT